MKVSAWRRRMMSYCFALMPCGLILIILGAVNSWGNYPLAGFGMGAVGLFLLVVGALCGKFGIAGPFPSNLEADK